MCHINLLFNYLLFTIYHIEQRLISPLDSVFKCFSTPFGVQRYKKIFYHAKENAVKVTILVFF